MSATREVPVWGPVVADKVVSLPPRESAEGQYIIIEPLSILHADHLFDLVGGQEHATLWDFLPDGPFTDKQNFRDHINNRAESPNSFYYAFVHKTTRMPVGFGALWRVDVPNRVIEIGHLVFSTSLQRTIGATECIYLLVFQAFDLGFRRVEWKCNNLHMVSKRSAQRLGFTFEGVFRQHIIVKGRNRDTAWFSIIDSEWPRIKKAFEAWLDPQNFDAEGHQRQSRAALREALP